LYQPANFCTQSDAARSEAKAFDGYCGLYFIVRNKDSEYGLSSLTRGRLNDGTTPRLWRVHSIVAPFIGPPLSECKVSWPSSIPSAAHVLAMSAAARSEDSVE
jgi:hypothetical protein